MLGIVTVVMTLLGWSSVPLFITHLAESIDVWTSNGWRYAFSALLWAPVLVWGLTRNSLPKGIWKAAIVPSIFNALGQAAFAWSFYNIDPATATFGLRLQIVFVAVGALLLFPSERAVLRRPAAWLGIALVLGGIAGTLAFANRGHAPKVIGSPAAHNFGVVLAVVAGLLFACYGLSVRKCMAAFHPVTAFAAISQYTSLVLVLFMFVMARNPRTHAPDFGFSAFALPASEIGWLLLSSLIGIALGHVFYYIAIARLGVAVSSGVIQLQPFCVALGQLLMFGIPLTVPQWYCGGLAVVGAMILLSVQWLVARAGASRPIAKQRSATCETCGYDLDGLEVPHLQTAGCPECGRLMPQAAPANR